ncbi:hypothetical protein H5410_005049 [Solanum commersonii]|uniref:At2g35280-like TPR domain-containing protein n=1 Tax=Solanum commersonii TaxID=4109 RepID=A0A9J6A712_SOLCO|nr:hypothetical protein H5410_005049 [Solanum commersonii]
MGSQQWVYGKVSMQEVRRYRFLRINDVRNVSLKAFVNKCIECGNIEAVYRIGMLKFCTNKNPHVGLELIDKASKGGHGAAKYAFGIVLICLGSEYSREGVKTIGEMKVTQK